MSSATFFCGVFGGAGGRGGRFSKMYLIFFFIISGIRVYFDTFSNIIPSYLEQELIQHTSDRSEKECIFEPLCANAGA